MNCEFRDCVSTLHLFMQSLGNIANLLVDLNKISAPGANFKLPNKKPLTKSKHQKSQTKKTSVKQQKLKELGQQDSTKKYFENHSFLEDYLYCL